MSFPRKQESRLLRRPSVRENPGGRKSPLTRRAKGALVCAARRPLPQGGCCVTGWKKFETASSIDFRTHWKGLGTAPEFVRGLGGVWVRLRALSQPSVAG